MEREKALNAAIGWFEDHWNGWTIEKAGDPDGKGERFKLFDPNGQPRHILGLTNELLRECESAETLWLHLVRYDFRKRFVLTPGGIVWLGTTGFLD